MTGKIFISYRRGSDVDAYCASLLFGELEKVFTRERIFMDVDNIQPGSDFVTVIEQQIAQCDVLLAVIGPGWLDLENSTGHRRLDDPEDFVRIEIASALDQGKRVIPILTSRASMPGAEQLPAALKLLARRQAVRITHEHRRADAQALIHSLQRALGDEQLARKTAVAAQTAGEGPAHRDSKADVVADHMGDAANAGGKVERGRTAKDGRRTLLRNRRVRLLGIAMVLMVVLTAAAFLLWPSDETLRRAQSSMDQGKYDQAIAVLTEGQRKDPENSDYKRLMEDARAAKATEAKVLGGP